MALALVMISSLGEDNDNEKLYPDYDDDVCSLINLILLPWIIVSWIRSSNSFESSLLIRYGLLVHDGFGTRISFHYTLF